MTPQRDALGDELALTAIGAAYAAIDVMVLVVDARSSVILSANPSFCRGSGYDANEICGRVFGALYDPQITPQTRRRIEGILASGSDGRVEMLARRRGGGGFWVDLALDPVDGCGGRFYAAVLRDITRQRQDLAEIARAHDLMQAIANGVPGVVYQFVIEADGRRHYSFISEGCRDLFGVEPGDVIMNSQDRILATVAPEARADLLRSIEESRAGLTPWLHVFRCHNGDQWRWVRGSARPHRQPNGATVWNGMLVDITEQQEARTTAEAASKAKSDFIANVSHELRTPLHAIIGLSEMLQRGLADPGQTDYADQIRSSGKSLLDLIDTVLDLSRIDAGRLELLEAETDVPTLVAPCIDILRGRLIGRVLNFQSRLERPLPRLMIDRRRIRQAVTNLLSNAVKFTPDGGKITLDAETLHDGGFALAVADTGIGMAPDSLARVFEPFTQLDAGRDRRNSGIGLGLTLSRAVLEAHGGRIALASEPGHGTEARLILPANRVRWG
jgi:two-component system, sensor histidine kinase and response regulator